MIDELMWTCFTIDPYTLQDRLITFATQIKREREREKMAPTKQGVDNIRSIYMSDST